MSQAFELLTEPDIKAPGTHNEVYVEVISEPAAFLERWKDIESLCSDLGQENVFYEAWALAPAIEHLGRDIQMRFAFLYEAGDTRRLCGFFPLVRKTVHHLFPMRMYEVWRHPHCFRCTPLIREGFARACWKALFTWLESLPSFERLLHISSLPDDSEAHRSLQQVLSSRTPLRHTQRSYQSAFLYIEADGEKTLRRAMSTSTLSKLRRQQRRLSEQGSLVFSELGAEEDFTLVVDEFLELEASGWKGRQGTALASKPDEEAFFRNLVHQAHTRNRLSLLTMRLNGKLIAAQTTLFGQTGSFLFKTAYDESYSRYSPGILLEIEHLRRMHNDKVRLWHQLRWSDSCAAPSDGPVYRCWPGRRTIHDYRIASGLNAPALLLVAWPVLRQMYRTLRPASAAQLADGSKARSL